jgi:PilZ domain
LKVPVELRCDTSDVPIRGATLDLSLGCCYIETFFPFPIGTSVEIKLQIDGTLLVMATVVTCDLQVGNGIRFDRMLPEDQEELRAYLQNALSAEEGK